MEPVTVEEAKARLGIRSDHRDAEILDLIPAAREHVEDLASVLLTRRQVRRSFPRFQGGKPLTLNVWPLVSLDALHYRDGAGALQPLAGGRLLADLQPGRIYPAVNSTWPVGGNPAEIIATVTAGYDPAAAAGDPLAVPRKLRQAMFLLIGHWFENHEAVVVGTISTEVQLGVRSLCQDFRDEGFS